MRPIFEKGIVMIKDWTATVKGFVKEHKSTIVALAIITPTMIAYAQHVGLKQHDEFLKEHDLYETFYAQTDDE